MPGVKRKRQSKTAYRSGPVVEEVDPPIPECDRYDDEHTWVPVGAEPLLQQINDAKSYLNLLNGSPEMALAKELIADAQRMFNETRAARRLPDPPKPLMEAARKLYAGGDEEKLKEFTEGLSDGYLGSPYYWGGDPEGDPNWIPVAGGGIEDVPQNLVVMRREYERLIARWLHLTNGHYRGIIENIVNYVCGTGITVTFKHPNKTIEDKAVKAWKKQARRVKFKDRCEEIVRRALRDGTILLRRFFAEEQDAKATDGLKTAAKGIDWRFVGPEFIREPAKATVGEGMTATLGVETPITDAEDIQAFWINPSNKPGQSKRVPADECLYIRIGVDANVKQGIPFLYTVTRLIRRYSGWLEDRIILNKVRAAIALLRKRTGTNPAISGGGQSLVDKMKTGSRRVPLGPGAGGGYREAPTVKLNAGAIIDVPDGYEYEYLSPKLEAGDVANDGRAIQLAIAVGVNMPEFIVSGDASNNNYASILVAEGPGTMALMNKQAFFCDNIAELCRKDVIDILDLSDDDADELECTAKGPNVVSHKRFEEAQANEIELRNGILPKTIWQEERGIDPERAKMLFQDEQTEPENPTGVRPPRGPRPAPGEPPDENQPPNQPGNPSAGAKPPKGGA